MNDWGEDPPRVTTFGPGGDNTPIELPTMPLPPEPPTEHDETPDADTVPHPLRIWVNGSKLYAEQVRPGTIQQADNDTLWVAGREDDQRMTWREFTPPPIEHTPAQPPIGWKVVVGPTNSDGWMHQHADDGRNWVHLWGTECDKGNGPGVQPVNRTTPTTETGQVDFRDMLTESWQPIARDRLNAVLKRPYLSTQLTAMLPADVCIRLLDRLEGLVADAVRAEVDRIQSDITEATRQALARLAAQADQKLEELHRERYSTPSRLD